jgi:hypothetical protein
MAFQVKELMVTLEPFGQTTTKPPCSCINPSAMIACGVTEAQCPTASALDFCGKTEGQCPAASALGFAAPDSRRNLALLRRDLAERSAN